MNIKTITCHEVYNYGASLQEYALLAYLNKLDHKAETIHYKPAYLCDRYDFWYIANKKYEKFFITKAFYIFIKLPERLQFLKRKKNFDNFSKNHIKTTKKLYKSNDELKTNLPEADIYICGSDQIWNSFFQNGKDPAFYLNFVPQTKLKISYAASFAIDKLENNIKDFVKSNISNLHHISVRESSGKTILEDLGIKNVTQVLDPVFLLNKKEWSKLEKDLEIIEDYIFVYDFDSNPLIQIMAKKIKKKTGWKIISVNKNIKYSDRNFWHKGPSSFLNLVKNAKFVISNSFHAVAFSIIFEKDFVVFNRTSSINTRMRDLLNSISLNDLLILDQNMIDKHKLNTINYNVPNKFLNNLIISSKTYLKDALEN
ncbi:polysaccharide pyruvyl transferase family protein [Algibacter sp. L4_22]|uniref:polysaccharide pyruvyl transferase family protein n=1 Tax=Algibacter sp. L4_22 TaxID=2942477 RepID=UPI00201B468C|nr:polysaccharide pyruvyl transferase family protein [Algibacter sp. L4_22]MCL5127855.1 polysaccharide pyruvyl transferase family protein [Algibacter sp. L4_22]